MTQVEFFEQLRCATICVPSDFSARLNGRAVATWNITTTLAYKHHISSSNSTDGTAVQPLRRPRHASTAPIAAQLPATTTVATQNTACNPVCKCVGKAKGNTLGRTCSAVHKATGQAAHTVTKAHVQALEYGLRGGLCVDKITKCPSRCKAYTPQHQEAPASWTSKALRSKHTQTLQRAAAPQAAPATPMGTTAHRNTPERAVRICYHVLPFRTRSRSTKASSTRVQCQVNAQHPQQRPRVMKQGYLSHAGNAEGHAHQQRTGTCDGLWRTLTQQNPSYRAAAASKTGTHP